MHTVLNPIYYFLLAGLLILKGCQIQGKDPTSPDKKEVTQRDLYRAAREQQKILLVDGWEQNDFQGRLRNLVEEYHSGDWELLVKDHHDVSREELATTPTILIGTPDQNLWIKEIMKELPFDMNGGNINLIDRSFSSSNHVMLLSYYPNPLNVKMPIGVFTSDNEWLIWDLVNERISSIFRSNWNYQVVKENQRILLGNLSQKPDTRWEVDAAQQIDLPHEAVQSWSSGPFIFHSYHQSMDAGSMEAISKECLRELSGIQKLSGVKMKAETINYYLYPTTEIKGLITGSSDQSHLDTAKMEVHTAFDRHLTDRYYGKENKLIIKLLMGHTPYKALETGLSVYFSSQWENQGYQYWARHLIKGGNSMTVEQLLDSERFDNSSRLIREALSASLVEFLLEKWGKAQFLKNYKNWQPDSEKMNQITDSWWSAVKEQNIDHIPLVKKNLPYLQGFNFTHEGYQIYNGYGSKMAEKSLKMVGKLGSNVVAVVPYSWMGNPQIPSNFRFSQRAGSENDQSVINTIYCAKEQGLYTLLKPHVWVSNSWPGEVDMPTNQHWDLFFDYYFQWISHYALLAEMYEVDVLCIGVEFSIATLGQERQWRGLIDKLRKIYSGNITYAANWGDEFEQITFWDQLDFIGLNCYYPLSKKNKSNQTELEQGFISVLEKVSNGLLWSWIVFENSLRNELVRLRAGDIGVSPDAYVRTHIDYDPMVAQLAREAMKDSSPLKVEFSLLQIRWNFLEDYIVGHYFDLTALIIYGLKLQLLERKGLFTVDKGQKVFHIIYEGNKDEEERKYRENSRD